MGTVIMEQAMYIPSLGSHTPSNLTRRLSLNLEYNICETRKILELSAELNMIGMLEVLLRETISIFRRCFLSKARVQIEGKTY